MTRRRSIPWAGIVATQVIVAVAFAAAFLGLSAPSRARLRLTFTGTPCDPGVDLDRPVPATIGPLYDDPEVVGDAALIDVLGKLIPAFDAERLKPNDAEHALRTWGGAAEFPDEGGMAGIALRDLLTQHPSYAASWGPRAEPLLIDGPAGPAIRWGRGEGASVHHDHWLSCLAEGGVRLDSPVRTASRADLTVRDALREALRDFQLDDDEVEWSAAAFALWLPPATGFLAGDGRRITFDALARRLIRGDTHHGDCTGTHRIYSLVLFWRLDERRPILSRAVRGEVAAYLERVRDQLVGSQADDGHWPWNWSERGEGAGVPDRDPPFRKVIATGHHLEWMAIAPESFQVPRERIRRAARWLVADLAGKTRDDIRGSYPYYSHVARALALWRNSTPWGARARARGAVRSARSRRRA